MTNEQQRRAEENNLRLQALDHAQELLEAKRRCVAILGRAVDRELGELVDANFEGDENDIYEAEMRLEYAELALCHEERRYLSAFSKLAFEVADCDRAR